MKYLFTYNYEAKKEGGYHVNGSGSIVVNAEGANKITDSMIFGEAGAVSLAKKRIMEEGVYDVKVAPMGWFKFNK